LIEYDVDLCLEVLGASAEACGQHLLPMVDAIEHPPVAGTLFKL
jgi:hypothetical protein